MKDFCEYCNAELTAPAKRVAVYRRIGGQHLIFEDVPARVCPRCGERYFTAAVVRRMERRGKVTSSRMPTVTVPLISMASG